MKTLRITISASILFLSVMLHAQSNGTLKGTVTNELGQAMPFATVALMDDSIIVTGTSTDDNGDYTIKEITPGKYTLRFSFVTYKTKKIKSVIIDPNQTAYVDAKMVPDNTLGVVEITETYIKPVINPVYSTVTSISQDQIDHMAVEKGDIISMIVNVTPGVMSTPDGKDLYVRGSRSGSTAYYIDGNRVMGSPEVPGMGIASLEVLTGGVPAEYGDCTGGLVIITTKDYKWEMHKKEVRRQEKAEAAAAEKENANETDE